MYFKKLTEKVKRITWSIHSTNTCAKETKVQWNVSLGSTFASSTQIFTWNAHTDPPEGFFHNDLALRKWKIHQMSFAAQMRNGNNLIQSADSITYSISNWRNKKNLQKYYNIACPTTNDTLVRLHSKSHQKSSTILRV